MAGNIRNKERSRKKFLTAVEKILKTKGYSNLKINNIATTAGVDKKMIYSYFGGLDGLLDEYIRSKDFWSNVTTDNQLSDVLENDGQALTKITLHSQFDIVSKSIELQKLLLWGLSEERKSLRKIKDQQEQNGEFLFETVTDPYFKENSEKFRAIMAILISGIYYLNLYRSHNGSVFCGIDLKTDEGQNKIKEALSFLVDQTYEKL